MGCNLFPSSRIVLRLVRDAQELGIVPVRQLQSSCSKANADGNPINDGNGPEKKFAYKLRAVKAASVLSSEGRVPNRLLDHMLIVTMEERLLN
jgi:hypothetical protein